MLARLLDAECRLCVVLAALERACDLDKNLQADEQNQKSEIEPDRTDTNRRNDSAQQLQGRIGDGVDELRNDQQNPARLPIAGEDLDEVEDQPDDEDDPINKER